MVENILTVKIEDRNIAGAAPRLPTQPIVPPTGRPLLGPAFDPTRTQPITATPWAAKPTPPPGAPSPPPSEPVPPIAPILPPAPKPITPTAAPGAEGAAGAAAAAGGPVAVALIVAQKIKEAAMKVAEALQTAARFIHETTVARTLEIQNQTLAAESVKSQRNYGLVASIVGTVNKEAGEAIRQLGNVRNEQREQFLEIDKAARQRIAELARYSPSIAQAAAQNRASQIQRDIGEADALGERLGGLAGRQRQLDTLQQQLAILEKDSILRNQERETNLKIAALQEQLNEKLKTANKHLAEQVRRMGRDTKSPMDLLLEGVRLPEAPGRDPLLEMAKQQLGIPIIKAGGL